MRKAVTVVTVLCVLAGPMLAGCSAQSEDSRGTGTGPSVSGLRQALSRVAATDDTLAWVGYDAIAELTKVVGKRPGRGFGLLLLRGTGLGSVALNAPTDTGIAPLDADYGIAAGLPPHTVTVLAGGQQADRIGTSLTTLGWARDGDRYVGPDPAKLTEDAGMKAVYGLTFAQVRPDGSDVVIGGPSAELGTPGHPLPGRTLADDQATAALADCLGDVVVAYLTIRYRSATTQQPAVQARIPHGVQLDKLTRVAVGVRTPKSTSDTPRAVVCTAWADQAAADGYAGALPGVLTDGTSLTAGVPYAQLLTHPQITEVGGDAHVVKWTADEPNGDESRLILQMLRNADVPGLG